MIRAETWARCLAITCVIALASCQGDSSSEVISGTPAKSAMVGRPYNFLPHVNSTAGADLTFMITNKPSWASFDPQTGRLSGTPGASEVGLFGGIRISVHGGPVKGSLAPFSITVTPPPKEPPVLNPNPVKTVTLYWEAPPDNSDGSALTNLNGYKIYYGDASRTYSGTIRVSNPGLTTYIVENLSPGRYYFAVTAYNSTGEESDFSPEVSTIVD
jgi:Putative Ig domain